tara:strand:- start:213 stop:329 length:117 start_codon:yes stop_codon:yes gene_type:complete
MIRKIRVYLPVIHRSFRIDPKLNFIITEVWKKWGWDYS